MAQDFDAERDAKARADRDKELDIPNFKALREWIDKLEDWCREEAEDRLKAVKRADALEDSMDKLDQEHAALTDIGVAYESLCEGLEDVERGIRTFEEFMDERRRRDAA